jgi:hypothetical protein
MTGWSRPQTLAGLSTASSPISHPSGSRLLVHLVPLKISAHGLSLISPSLYPNAQTLFAAEDLTDVGVNFSMLLML